MIDISAMQEHVGDEQAAAIISRHTGGAAAAVERRVFYPYFHVPAHGRLRWLFGEKQVALDCLVDARTGTVSSADALRLERRKVSATESLPVQQDADSAISTARRYASHALARGFKVLGNFNLDVRDAVLVHRPFWIVRTEQLRVLVDAVTGELHPLSGSPGPNHRKGDLR